MIFFFLITCLSDGVVILQEEIMCWSIIWIFLFVCFPHLFMYLLFSLVRFFLQHQTANFLPPSLDSRLFSVWSFSPSTSICSRTERSLLDFHYWSPGCCQECCNFLVLSFDCFSQSIITPFLTWSIIVMKSLRTYTITYTEEFFCLTWQRYVWQFATYLWRLVSRAFFSVLLQIFLWYCFITESLCLLHPSHLRLNCFANNKWQPKTHFVSLSFSCTFSLCMRSNLTVSTIPPLLLSSYSDGNGFDCLWSIIY